MIDDDDVEFAILASPVGEGAGCFWSVVFVLIIVALIIAAAMNNDECGKRHCPDGGRPKLLKNECLCVTEAK
jgi:hypothetical protein